jgi:hypothetical protein
MYIQIRKVGLTVTLMGFVMAAVVVVAIVTQKCAQRVTELAHTEMHIYTHACTSHYDSCLAVHVYRS